MSWRNHPKLKLLMKKVDGCPFCNQEENKLQHVLGGGKSNKPDYFFVLINPTYRNITTNPDHQGIRIPFMGVSEFWKALVEPGFLPPSIYYTTERKVWDERDIQFVNDQLIKNKIYLTNLVKCAGQDATLPKSKRINWGLGILKEEITIINPKLIITLGQIPFEALTGKKIRLTDHYQEVLSGNLKFYDLVLGKRRYKVFPTYFPTGRGEPKKCIEILKRLTTKMI